MVDSTLLKTGVARYWYRISLTCGTQVLMVALGCQPPHAPCDP